MSDSVHVKGLAELQKFLSQLPAKMETKIMRGAVRAGAVVLRDEAKAQVPVDSGQLRDGLKVSTRSRRGVVSASVKATGPHSYVARWMEYGVAAHPIAAANGGSLFFGGFFHKSAEHPGITPRPFMRPALDNAGGQAVVAAGQYIKTRLTKQGLEGAGDVEVAEV